MTLLASWVGIDTHGPASIYIASDSRISWGSKEKYDYGRKVFALKQSPDIFGYCGDVLFPSLVLSQVSEMADSYLLFAQESSSEEKFAAIREKLIYQFSKYPHEVETITGASIEILHASRDPTNGNKFVCNLLKWKRKNGWQSSGVELPEESGPLFVRGSGAHEFETNFVKCKKGPNAGTSRNVFHCFCDSLFTTKEPAVGGAPQLAGLIRKPGSAGMYFGIIVEDHRYYLGAPIDELSNFDRLVWRNELFEICDGRTGKRKAEAQPQPNPYR